MKFFTKKLHILTIALLLITALAVSASATSGTKSVEIAYRGISIVVGSSVITPCDATGKAVEPFILDGTTYLPVRAVANALGLDVKWDSATSTVTITDGAAANFGSGTPAASTGKQTIEAAYRDIKIVVNGKTIVPMDANGNAVEPFIYDGTTYLPVRAVANALGVEVDWDAATSTVLLGGTFEYLLSRISVEKQDGDWDYSEETVYSYNDAGLLLKSVYTAPDVIETVTNIYDNSGRLSTYERVHDAPAQKEAPAYRVYTEYYYGADGRLERTVERDYNTQEETTATIVCLFSYDTPEGTEKRVTSYYPWQQLESTVTELYDEKDQLLSSLTEYEDGSRDGCTVTYDENGNMLSVAYVSYDPTLDCESSSEYFYTYDAQGNTLTDDEYMNGKLFISETNTYDEKGNILSRLSKRFSDDGDTWYRYDYMYTYDAAGNCVSETRSFTDCEGASETQRFDRIFDGAAICSPTPSAPTAAAA